MYGSWNPPSKTSPEPSRPSQSLLHPSAMSGFYQARSPTRASSPYPSFNTNLTSSRYSAPSSRPSYSTPAPSHTSPVGSPSSNATALYGAPSPLSPSARRVHFDRPNMSDEYSSRSNGRQARRGTPMPPSRHRDDYPEGGLLGSPSSPVGWRPAQPGPASRLFDNFMEQEETQNAPLPEPAPLSKLQVQSLRQLTQDVRRQGPSAAPAPLLLASPTDQSASAMARVKPQPPGGGFSTDDISKNVIVFGLDVDMLDWAIAHYSQFGTVRRVSGLIDNYVIISYHSAEDALQACSRRTVRYQGRIIGCMMDDGMQTSALPTTPPALASSATIGELSMPIDDLQVTKRNPLKVVVDFITSKFIGQSSG